MASHLSDPARLLVQTDPVSTVMDLLAKERIEKLRKARKFSLSLAALCVIAFGVGIYLTSAAHFNREKPPKVDLSVIEITLRCLSGDSIETVRNSGSIEVMLPRCAQELRAVLGDEFRTISDESIRAILATVVAANFAEYGASSAQSYEEIKNSSYVDCSRAGFLVGHLLDALESENLKPIGFDGGFIGNHAQLLFQGNGETILLDPTAGIIATTSFDDLLRGIPLHEKKIRAFSIKDKSINSFRETVYIAINRGKYLPSDFMYMHESVAEQIRGGSDSYFTPGGITVRTRLKNQS